MFNRYKYYLLAVLAVVLFVGANSVYIVAQPEQAIVLQFGEPMRLVKEPGLKFKVPFIQNVVIYDTRLLNLDPPAQEIVLNDKKRLDVDSFTRYKIVDPLRFYKTVRTEEQARGKLAEIVNSSVRKILGRITLPELLSQKRTQIMSDISSAVKSDAAQIGVSVADVRIRRADLPLQVLQAINARMKTERERDAKEFRAQGQQQAQQIRAKAEKERIERNAKRAGRSITDYLVLLSLETPIQVAEDVKPLLIELKRIGNNLNQITAKINAGAFRSYNFEDMIDGQKKIYEQLLDIARKG